MTSNMTPCDATKGQDVCTTDHKDGDTTKAKTASWCGRITSDKKVKGANILLYDDKCVDKAHYCDTTPGTNSWRSTVDFESSPVTQTATVYCKLPTSARLISWVENYYGYSIGVG